ncbi:MAG: AAA family ATPase [Microthrixaceae bacterium]
MRSPSTPEAAPVVFLKTLEIRGFKSFADAAVLELEPGVTVVVGPNGSGKSNVVDAIGWVLGAQAPSAVRSQKMDDVIFAGSANRGQLGRAEVALTIDNTAGVLPIEFSEVTIRRTLFRSGESEYAINDVPSRLLDIQDLLSDSGVGRQQHVIISQGQIDAVLNAKPEDRRLVIEEAAGVLKYRRRKEKSERRLAATEENLLRVSDLHKEVRRALRPLERQADAARRHQSVVDELTALRIHLAGREVVTLRTRATDNSRERTALQQREREAVQALAGLDREILTAEAQIAALGGEDVGDDLVRCEGLYERVRGLSNLMAERRRGIERERHSFVDEGVVATLESEHADLRGELDQLDLDGALRDADWERIHAATAELDRARAAFEERWAGALDAVPVEGAELRGEMSALRAAMSRTEADRTRADAQLRNLVARVERLEDEHTGAVDEHAALAERVDPLAHEAALARQRCGEAEAAAEAAEVEAAEAAANRHAVAARVEALSLALDEARRQAGAERLAGLDGVIGTLLDVVDVDEQYRAAFEAAAGEALSAVLVQDVRVASAALQALSEGAIAGAVLALTAAVAAAPDAVAPANPRVGADSVTPVRRLVRSSRPGVEALLDVLVGRSFLVHGTWADAARLAERHPDVVLVTGDGDRFAPDGWRVGRSTAGATGVALAEAGDALGDAEEVHRAAADRLTASREAARVAREDRADREREHEAATRRLALLVDTIGRLEADRVEAAHQVAAVGQHRDELEVRAGNEAQRLRELEERLPAVEEAERSLDERAREMATARRRIDDRAAEVAAMRTDVEVRYAAVDDRRRFLGDRIATVEERLNRNHAARAAAEERRHELDARAEVTDRLVGYVDDRIALLAAVLDRLRDAASAVRTDARSRPGSTSCAPGVERPSGTSSRSVPACTRPRSPMPRSRCASTH